MYLNRLPFRVFNFTFAYVQFEASDSLGGFARSADGWTSFTVCAVRGIRGLGGDGRFPLAIFF